MLAQARKTEPKDSSGVLFINSLYQYGRAGTALFSGDAAASLAIAQPEIEHLRSFKPRGGLEEFNANSSLFYANDLAGQAQYMLADYQGAEKSMREALQIRTRWPVSSNVDRRDQAEVSTILAMSMARLGWNADAAQIIAPVVKLHRSLARINQGDHPQTVELAAALYAQALADKTQRATLLHEAAVLVDSIPPQMRALKSSRLWRERIGAEMRRTANTTRDALSTERTIAAR
jgi:hypothetical protein